MPAFRQSLGEAERWKAVAFLRRLSLGGVGRSEPVVAAHATSAHDVGPVFAEVRRLVGQAADAHRRGDPAAVDLASDAYMRFEPLELALGARDPSVVRDVEEAFLALRGGLRRPGADVAALATAVEAALARAESLLGSRADAWARFVQSAAIILREGFEVVLILGALLAWVVKSGSARMKRPIYAGALGGVAASLATAVLLSTVLRFAPGTSEVVEGAAMLLASAVLFWVSYWIVSKAEAERWQRYIRGKVEQAVAAGSGTALAAAAFLAVYREGFETVLFYQALLASAPAGDVAVVGGFVTGAALLAVVYLGLARIGVRIPIRQFFLATGALLIVMAISFAGKGVHELQEAGVVSLTPLAWVPQLEFVGVFPTLESVCAQAVLLLLVAYAAFVTLRRRRPALAEVRPLGKRAAPGNRRA
jgi:high-affinity iron transporter